MIRLGPLPRLSRAAEWEHVAYCRQTGRDEQGWTHAERLRAAFMWNTERVGLDPRRVEFAQYLARRSQR